MPVSSNRDSISEPASVLESGRPEYNDNQAELIRVITEQPSQQLDLLSQDVNNEEESADTVAIVEQALSSTLINEATGYTLKYSGFSCSPCWEIIPNLNQFPIAQEDVHWKVTTCSSNEKCDCCCCFVNLSIGGGNKWRTITLKENEDEILNFLYSPMGCFRGGRNDRLVHMYIPQRNQRIAVLRQGNKFSDDMVLTDFVSKSVFMVKTLVSNAYEQNSAAFTMQVLNQQGTLIAMAQPTQSQTRRDWTTWNDFELEFNTNIPSDVVSVSSKSAILVAFAVWTINYREENARSMLLWSLLGIIITILLVALTIFYDSNYIY